MSILDTMSDYPTLCVSKCDSPESYEASRRFVEEGADEFSQYVRLNLINALEYQGEPLENDPDLVQRAGRLADMYADYLDICPDQQPSRLEETLVSANLDRIVKHMSDYRDALSSDSQGLQKVDEGLDKMVEEAVSYRQGLKYILGQEALPKLVLDNHREVLQKVRGILEGAEILRLSPSIFRAPVHPDDDQGHRDYDLVRVLQSRFANDAVYHVSPKEEPANFIKVPASTPFLTLTPGIFVPMGEFFLNDPQLVLGGVGIFLNVDVMETFAIEAGLERNPVMFLLLIENIPQREKKKFTNQ